MAARISTRLRNFLVGQGSLKRALTGGKLKIYTGTQPASGDAAVTGTLLATLSQSGGAITEEVLSRGKVTLTGGASGTVNGITVNSVQIMSGAVSFNSTLAQTVIDVVNNINSFESYPDYRAIASGTDILIEAQPGTGTAPNGYAVVSNVTTITSTDVNMGTTVAGVAQANGLAFSYAASGALSMSGTWSGTGVANGTAGWARFEGSIADDDSLDSTNQLFIRFDCSVGTTGADLNLVSTTVAIGGTVSVSSFTFTQPAA